METLLLRVGTLDQALPIILLAIDQVDMNPERILPCSNATVSSGSDPLSSVIVPYLMGRKHQCFERYARFFDLAQPRFVHQKHVPQNIAALGFVFQRFCGQRNKTSNQVQSPETTTSPSSRRLNLCFQVAAATQRLKIETGCQQW